MCATQVRNLPTLMAQPSTLRLEPTHTPAAPDTSPISRSGLQSDLHPSQSDRGNLCLPILRLVLSIANGPYIELGHLETGPAAMDMKLGASSGVRAIGGNEPLVFHFLGAEAVQQGT